MYRVLTLLIFLFTTQCAWAIPEGRGESPNRPNIKVAPGFKMKNGKFVSSTEAPSMAVQDHFSHGVEAMEKEDWREAAKQFKIVVVNFPDSPYEHEARYNLGVAYFHTKDFDYADEAFTSYLLDQRDLAHFEDAAQYKLAIAEAFRHGARKRLFGLARMPRLFTSRSTAIRIYDDIISMMPGHEIAAQALLAKGELLLSQRDFTQAVDSLQLLTRRFPNNSLAAEAYARISEAYARQQERETNNPDILTLAELNLQRLEQHFPEHDALTRAYSHYARVREVCAEALFETGKFFERTKKPRAAAIYFLKAQQEFPDTAVAQKCEARLKPLEAHVAELRNGTAEAAI